MKTPAVLRQWPIYGLLLFAYLVFANYRFVGHNLGFKHFWTTMSWLDVAWRLIPLGQGHTLISPASPFDPPRAWHPSSQLLLLIPLKQGHTHLPSLFFLCFYGKGALSSSQLLLLIPPRARAHPHLPSSSFSSPQGKGTRSSPITSCSFLPGQGHTLISSALPVDPP